MSRKNEEYPVFSEIKLDEVPSDAVVREIPGRNNVAANIYALASFILAILSIVPCLIVFSAPVSAVGFILAIVALCKKTCKKGFAVSGLLINLLSFAASVIFVIFFTSALTDFYTNAFERISSML